MACSYLKSTSTRTTLYGAAQMLATRGHKLVKDAKAKIDCEAALGEMLAQTVFDVGGRPSLNQSPGATAYPRLSELGINKNQSSRWQLIAASRSMNLRRRRLDENQRTMVGARLANMPRGHPKKRL